MGNKKSIQILRNAPSYDVTQSDEILLSGQPFHNTTENTLIVGDGITELKNLKDVAALNKRNKLGSVALRDGVWDKPSIVNSNGLKIGVLEGDIVPGAQASGMQSAAFGGMRHDYAGAWEVTLGNGTTYNIIKENSEITLCLDGMNLTGWKPEQLNYSVLWLPDGNVEFSDNATGDIYTAIKYGGLLTTIAEGAQSIAAGASCYANGDWSFASGRSSETYLRASAAFGASRAGRTPEEWIEYCASNSYNGALISFTYAIPDCYLALNYPNLKLPSHITVNPYNRYLICELTGENESNVPMGRYINDSFEAYIESDDMIRYIYDSTDFLTLIEISVKEIYKIFLDYTGRPFNQAYSFAFASGTSTASGRQSFAAVGAEATSDNAIAIGSEAKSDGVNCISIGTGSHASVNVATAVGAFSEATATMATAVGYKNIANKVGSTAIGTNISGLTSYATGIGAFPEISDDSVFVVGDGKVNAKHTALEVKQVSGNYSLYVDGYRIPLESELSPIIESVSAQAVNSAISKNLTEFKESFIVREDGQDSIIGGYLPSRNSSYVNGYGCVGLGLRPKVGDILDHTYVHNQDRSVVGAIAMGTDAICYSSGSVAIGTTVKAFGAYDVTIGKGNSVGIQQSTPIKKATYGYNTILGLHNTVTSYLDKNNQELPYRRTVILGVANTVTRNLQVLLGTGTDTSNSPIFAIGDGVTSNVNSEGSDIITRRNALEIQSPEDGFYKLILNNAIMENDSDVVVKKYVDDLVANTATISVTYEDGTVEDLEVIIK